MKKISEVYEALKRINDKICFDERHQIIELPDYNIKAYEENSETKIEIELDGQIFRKDFSNCDILFDFLSGILNETVTISRIDEREIRVNGFDLYKNIKVKNSKNSVVSRVINIIFGIPLTLFGALFTIFGFSYVDYNSPDWLEAASPFPLALTVFTIGVSLIHHGCVKKRLNAAGAFVYGLGVIITGFALAMFMITFNDRKDMATADFIGCLFLFALILFIGLFMIIAGLIFNKTQAGRSFHVFFIKRIPPLPSETDRLRLLERIVEKTETESISVTLDNSRQPTVFDSKFGGVPYWDISLPCPLDNCGNSMYMLAQINCEQLPENEKLPKSGMLQFFVPEDMCDCRILYHRHISPDYLPEENPFPSSEDIGIIGESAISFEKQKASISPNDNEAKKILFETAEELGIELDKTLLFRELVSPNATEDSCESFGSHLLGYPQFHPWEEKENRGKYDKLLFQIDSIEEHDFSLVCGDYGTAYIFINSEDLKNLNFNDTIFDLDCY